MLSTAAGTDKEEKNRVMLKSCCRHETLQTFVAELLSLAGSLVAFSPFCCHFPSLFLNKSQSHISVVLVF